MIDKNKKVLVLGAYGRCGKPLVDLLDKNGYKNLLYPTSKACDLLDNFSCEAYFRSNKPEYVFNLAAKTTNIMLCNEYPVNICRDTLQMNIAVLDLCRRYAVEKLLNVVCSCSYPADKDILKEEDFFSGSPHESVMAHGLSKRMVYYLGRSYATQYKMNIVTVGLNNIFGGLDDWSKPTSLKFLDSLIVKVVNAKKDKQKSIRLWGSGYPQRECLHAKDAAEGLLKVFENYDNADLINIGVGEDKTIRQWLSIIMAICKYKGDIIWDETMPSGQQKKLFSIEKQQNILQWTPPTNIYDAIKETVEDYKNWLKIKEKNNEY